MVSVEHIRLLVREGNIMWTTHTLARLQERNIDPDDVRHVLTTGEIIEAYPTDYPYPSNLVFGITLKNQALHVVVGIGAGKAWIVTAYYPDLIKWYDDFKTRRDKK